MSYIQDDEQMIKSCIKYIDEDKIVDFLNSIEFEFEDASYVLQTSNASLIELCIDEYLHDDVLYALLDTVDELLEDNTISDIAVTTVKNTLLKQENPDIIYQILTSNWITWQSYKNPFESGYFNGDNNVSSESILNQDEVNTLFNIYAEHEHWLKNGTVYVKDKESLIAHFEDDDYDFAHFGEKSIDSALPVGTEEFVKDYFDRDVPEYINAATLADIMIKCGFYDYL